MPVQHLALFGFKTGTSPAVIDRAFQELHRLTKVIPGITAFSGGPNNSPEGLADGLSHGFVMTFQDAPSRDAYLPHSEHEKFKSFVLPHIQKVVVLDYDC